MKKISFVLFSGGTGGHVIPAVNFGNFLIDCGYECNIFIDTRGIKFSKNFKGKIIKNNSSHFSGNIFFKICTIFLLFLSFFQCVYNLFKIKPTYCIGFGGYASFMPLIVSIILKKFNLTEIFLHEQNTIIGKVNLFFLTFSKNIFLNFNYVKNLKPNHINKVFHVGLPYNNKFIYKKRNTQLIKQKK